MEYHDGSEYHYRRYREGNSYQESGYQGADPPIVMSNGLTGNPGYPYAWPQSAISQDVHGHPVDHAGELQQYPPPYLNTTYNRHHQPLYDQQVYVASLVLQPQCPSLDLTNVFGAEAHYGYMQTHDSIPDGHDGSSPPLNGPQNNSLPFAQHGSMEASPTSSLTSRQLATDAVSDAAEKRRINPHRFFCQYCDRGFTARHNYHRHLGAHNDERPFSCECGSGFTTKSDLKRHKFKSKKHGNGQDYATGYN